MILAFDMWRRNRHDQHIRKLLSAAVSERTTPYDNERLVRLSEDGDLVDFEPAPYDGKKKKRETDEYTG